MQQESSAAIEHRIVDKYDVGRDILHVECACGYWQHVRWMAFFRTVWLTDEQHLYWASQQAAVPAVRVYQQLAFADGTQLPLPVVEQCS